MLDSTETNKPTETSEKVYICQWAEACYEDFGGTMSYILNEFTDLDPDDEVWFAWDYFRGDYVTGGGVTINEFHRDSNVFDKIECENMTIMRVA